MKNFKQSGFTLIELIIVIAIIALLAAATFVAVNPAKRIGDANNAQRWSDVTAIADAYMNYLVDNVGVADTSTGVTNGQTYYIQHTGAAAATTPPTSCTGSTTVTTASPIDLHGLVTAGYIGDIPDDPGGTDGDGTDYYFYTDAQGIVIVGSCTKYSGTTNYAKVIR